MAEAKESHHDFWDLPADSAQSCSFDPGVEVGVGGWVAQIFEGSFSAVSTPNFAGGYSVYSMFRGLQI